MIRIKKFCIFITFVFVLTVSVGCGSTARKPESVKTVAGEVYNSSSIVIDDSQSKPEPNEKITSSKEEKSSNTSNTSKSPNPPNPSTASNSPKQTSQPANSGSNYNPQEGTVLPQPDIISPVNGSTVDSNHLVTVTWKPVEGASDYKVYWNKVPAQGGAVLGLGPTTSTSAQIFMPEGAKYAIYVRANVGGYIRAGNGITVVAPQPSPIIQFPTAGATLPVQDLTLKWNDPYGLKGFWFYNVVVSDSQHHVFDQGFSPDSSVHSVTIPVSSLPSGSYRFCLVYFSPTFLSYQNFQGSTDVYFSIQ